MDKLKFYRLATLGLLILNISMVLFFLLSPAPGQENLRGGANTGLGLDEQQSENFLVLAQEHQSTMRIVSQEQRIFLESYFQQLTTNASGEPPSLPTELLSLEERKITSTYQHLLDVKGLLRPDQLDNYPDFVRLAMSRILGNNRKPLPPKKE